LSLHGSIDAPTGTKVLYFFQQGIVPPESRLTQITPNVPLRGGVNRHA
jgi:hypothetical protein